jgi:hypothetical protein
MHGAGPGGHQQGAAVVFGQHARRLQRRQVADRIRPVADVRLELRAERQHLQQQRVARIAGPHARDEGARHAQAETGRGATRGGQQRRVQREHPQQLGRVGDGLRQLPAPRGKVTRRRIGRYHWRIRSHAFHNQPTHG